MIQYNFKIEPEVKEKLYKIARIESEKHKMNIKHSQITRKAIDIFIENWEKDNKDE